MHWSTATILVFIGALYLTIVTASNVPRKLSSLEFMSIIKRVLDQRFNGTYYDYTLTGSCTNHEE